MDPFWGNIFRKNEDDQSLFSYLGKIHIFKGLKTQELKAVERIVHLRTYKPDEVIFERTDPGVGMYIIRSGSVRIVLSGDDNPHPLVLAQLNKDDFFGEASLPDGGPRSATALANEETTLIGLFRPDLLDLCHRDPHTGYKVLWNVCEVLAARLRRTNMDLSRQDSSLKTISSEMVAGNMKQDAHGKD